MSSDKNKGGFRFKGKEVILVAAGGAVLGGVAGVYRGGGVWNILAGAVGGAIMLTIVWHLGQAPQGPR